MKRHNSIQKRECQLSEIGSAVGVDKRKWYIARVKNNTELSSSEKLRKMGYETFVALQEIVEEHNGKRMKRKKVVASTYLFVYVTEKERKEIVNLSFILRFTTNTSGQVDTFGRKPLAIIPDKEMDQFRTLIEKSETEVCIEAFPRKNSRKVKICSGALKGLSGYAIHVSEEKHFFVMSLSYLGCAKISISNGVLKPRE